MKVYLVGCGMGNPDTMTIAAKRAIESCNLLIGAKRLIEPYENKQSQCLALINSQDIVAALKEAGDSVDKAAVLLSGDLGFYSGATLLRSKLAAEDFEVESIPGISSLVYFCAKLGLPWQDVHLVSAHGRTHNAVGEIQCHAKTFLLTGGATKVQDVCCELVQRGLGFVQVHVGERLSYEDERLVHGTAQQLAGDGFADLSVMLVENPRALDQNAMPGISDEAFLRGKVPMTKAEVRSLSLCKLRLQPWHVVWDVGAGTGSISLEAARIACAGRVFAIEKNPDALDLLQQNKEAFGAVNMEIVAGSAPDALEGLPVPQRVFVGGSSGQLEGIFKHALALNPHVRFVVNAITLETLAEAIRCMQIYGMDSSDICQLQVSRAHMAGSNHLMMGHNPVYIICAQRDGE